MKKRALTISLVALFLNTAARADVTLPRIFSDGMVLQREQPIAIWGWADPGEFVVVRLKNQQQKTTADCDGKWNVRLSPETAGGPFKLEVAGNNALVLTDVLIGEVWICAGQSNMQWPVIASTNGRQEIAASNYTQIRHIAIPRKTSGAPLQDMEQELEWKTATPENVGYFTAVGYFFARELYAALNVPIGLINASWGGTVVETWTSKEALQKNKSLRKAIRIFEETPADTVQSNTNPNRYPTLLFNAMVNPLIPFSIRGVVWYQGESNASRAYEYRKSFPMMITDWRERWGLGDFPFYFVQLAGFSALGGTSSTGSTWAELREAQHRTLKLSRTGMAVTIDIGESDDIHPRNKQDVGKRLAAIALHDTYGRDIAYSGPVYRKHHIDGNQIAIAFDHGGLTTKGGERIVGFEVAGSDKVFYPASAIIRGSEVVVHANQVSKPVAVRYAWADDPGKSNLFNDQGFPTAPFRTDNWASVTKDVKYAVDK